MRVRSLSAPCKAPTTWVRARLPGRQRSINLIAAGELWLRARGGFCLISPLRLHAFVVDRGRVSARQPTYFLQPESRQRVGPLLPTSLRFAAGNLRRQALGAVRQNSLRVFDAPFKHVAVKVMTMQLHTAVQLPAPRPCRRRRGHKGQYRVRDSSE